MSRRSRIVMRALACSVLTFLVGVTVAWRQLPALEPQAVPQTLNQWGAFMAALVFCIAAGVWAAKGLIAIRNVPPTPPQGQQPVGNGTLMHDVATSLALLEAQRETLEDLKQAQYELRHGLQDMTHQVKRVADALERKAS